MRTMWKTMRHVMLSTLCLVAMLMCQQSVLAGVVDTIAVRSEAMNKNVKVAVVIPEKQTAPCPVVYLLHGHGGDYRSWLSIRPELKEMADQLGIIFVCPNGENSWYWDSPVDPKMRYETFVSKELIAAIDAKYKTIQDRTGRAITGLSMGGHGAMWLSIRHKDVFGAAGSTSGGVDIRPFPNNWGMATLLGPECDNRTVWDNHTAINQIDRLKDGELALIIDCGYDDFFFEVNNDFHNKLLKYHINHDFVVRPGRHNGEYWRNSILYQINFFWQYFNKSQKND